MLGLLRRTFSRYNSHHSKKLLYIHLVRSQLIYCSQIWRPYLLKDIIVLENVQRRGTKFILNDFTADYKTRLLSLNLLPLAMLYELNDILFFIKSLKKPTAAFHILDYVSFCSNCTRSASFTKLVNKSARTNTINHSYFYRLSLEFAPPQLIFLLVSTLLKGPSNNSPGITLSIILIHVIIVHFIIYVRVISV